MCGIAGIILKKKATWAITDKIADMSTSLRHRGPDGEGFVLADESVNTPCTRGRTEDAAGKLPYSPVARLKDLRTNGGIFLAFAHRRLSIIDLSVAGHQPMCDASGRIWLNFNGEIYNYIELRNELKSRGHTFMSDCDSEVIIAAYLEWGPECVNRFNGMWAFCIYDSFKKLCFASRDRLGVKPFYFYNSSEVFSFASEQKSFIAAGITSATIRDAALHNYLVNNLLETSHENFFEGISELMPGENLIYDLALHTFRTYRYFHINDILSHNNDHLNDEQLTERVREYLFRAVKIRLRSDVEVGTCLSGGIDSSALALLIASLESNPLSCFTAIFRGRTFNEEMYADIVAESIHAKHFKTEPTLEGFLHEVDNLVYSQDVPIWDTSTYAQFKVMELAANNKIKVVLDGQGADELFAGYHHHFLVQWKELLKSGKWAKFIHEMNSAKRSISSPLMFFLKEYLKEKCNMRKNPGTSLLKKEFLASGVSDPTSFKETVNEQLVDDIYRTRLKMFLKCEDRCGMWHSVESRTPFSDDIELIKLMFSFSGNRKIKNGVSKYFLREGLKNELPERIYKRYDKKGFETPMSDWTNDMRPLIEQEIRDAGFSFVTPDFAQKSNTANNSHNKMLFKLFILARWKKIFVTKTTVVEGRH